MIGSVINLNGAILAEKSLKQNLSYARRIIIMLGTMELQKQSLNGMCTCGLFSETLKILVLRYSFTIAGSDLTLIHYKGDDSVVKNDSLHVRTCPSVLKVLQDTTQSPSVVYKKQVSLACCSNEHQPVLIPRNRKQVSNMQALQRQKVRLSHDGIYNLHELAYDIPDFVHKIITYPDLVVVCGLKGMLKECNRLLSLRLSNPQILSYDTTFQLGDFYVSPLLFRNVLFRNSPVMPAMFAIHERKLKATHAEVMRIVAEQLPYLVNGTSKVPLVTDDETGITSAVDYHLCNVQRLLCWNHTINAAKTWLRKHGAVAGEVPVYISNLRELLHQEKEETYCDVLDELKVNWSEAFLTYYMENLDKKVFYYDVCSLIDLSVYMHVGTQISLSLES